MLDISLRHGGILVDLSRAARRLRLFYDGSIRLFRIDENGRGRKQPIGIRSEPEPWLENAGHHTTTVVINVAPYR